jgi:hypothetical protein
VFGFANSSSTDAITSVDIGATVFAVDDETVARTSGNNLRPRAGRVVGFEGSLVLVELGVFGEATSGIDVRIAAGEALTSDQYKAVKLSSGAVVKCGAGERALGILQNAPGSGEIAIVRIAGTTLAKADGTGVAVDNMISSAAGGVLRASTNQTTGLGHVDTTGSSATQPLRGAYVLGQATQAGAAGALFAMVINTPGAVATTAV